MEKENTSDSKNSWYKINPPVFFGSAGIIAVFVIFTLLSPARAVVLFGSIQGWTTETVGWFYILSVATFLLFVVFLGLSKFGNIKLGPARVSKSECCIVWPSTATLGRDRKFCNIRKTDWLQY